MPLQFHWQIPTRGDGRYGNAQPVRRGERTPGQGSPYSPGVTDPRGDRFNFFDHVHQVARAAELSGFDAAVVRHDVAGDESWIVAGYVARGTRRLKLITEFEASWGSSVYAAKNAVSFSRFTGGRFGWQLVPGAGAATRLLWGDPLEEGDVLPRIAEFLTVSRGVIAGSPFSFKGRFFEVKDGGFTGSLGDHAAPTVFLVGESEAALSLSAEHADVHVFEASSLSALRGHIHSLRVLAKRHGREVKAAVRVDVLGRETESEALFDANRYAAQSGNQNAPRTTAGLWTGLGTDVTGAAATLVGSYTQVAQRLSEYVEAGVEVFQLAGVPHLEEAFRVGAHILPLVRERAKSSVSQPASPRTLS